MNAHDATQAESAVQRRKGEIYAVLRTELRRRTRRRRAARAAAAGAMCVVAAATALLLRTAGPSSTGTPAAPSPPIAHVPTPAQKSTPPPPPAARVAIIRTDPGIVARLAVRPPTAPLVRRIDDSELLAALDEAGGERFGLVRTGAQVAVVCQTCVAGSHAGPAWMQELRREWTGRVRPGHPGVFDPGGDRAAPPL